MRRDEGERLWERQGKTDTDAHTKKKRERERKGDRERNQDRERACRIERVRQSICSTEELGDWTPTRKASSHLEQARNLR